MAQHLIASAATLRAVKPGDAGRRLGAGAGLYLLLFVNGGSHGWRLDYSIHGRRKTLSTYPSTSLSAAHLKAEDAGTLVGAGTGPHVARQQQRQWVDK